MNFRRLFSSECEAYWDLRLQSLKESPEAYGSTFEEEAAFTPEVKVQRCQWSDDQFVIGALAESEQLVGIIGLIRENRVKSRHKAVITGMYVLPEFRTLGIGRKLMTTLLEEARSLPGLARLSIFVVGGNHAAKNLYEHYGFEVYGIEPDAKRQQGISYDMIQMSLAL